MKCKILCCLLLVAFAPIASQAQTTYSWSGGTDTNWTTSGNWAILSGSGTIYPASGDTAVLGDVSSGTRSILYSTAGSLGTLTMSQATSGAVNKLTLQASMTLSSDLYLGATAGTTTLYVNSTSGTVVLTVGGGSGTITVGSGGILELGAYNDKSSKISGNVVVNGGSLVVDRNYSGNGRSQTIDGSVSISSGTITVASAVTGYTGADSRLQINKDFTATGGSIVSGSTVVGAGSVMFMGANNDLSGLSSFDSKLNLWIAGSSTTGSKDQNVNIGSLAIGSKIILRNDTSNTTATKVISASDGGSVSAIAFASTAGAANLTLALGSDLKLASGAATPVAGSTGVGTSTQLTYTIDTGSYTFDMSAGAGALNLNNQSTTPTYWTLQGSGTIKARSFVLSSAYRSTVSGSLTLMVTGSPTTTSGTIIDMRNGTSAGTISATSTLLYAGSDTVAAPATLLADRTIGKLSITSGYLKINQSSLSTGGNVSLSGGSLDLNGTGTAGLLSLAADTSFTMTGGTLILDLGTTLDQIVGSGTGLFSLSGGTISLNLTSGFDYAQSYQIFSGFSGGSISNITFTGLDSSYQASLNSAGILTFTSVPEPSVAMLLTIGVVAVSLRRRGQRAKVG